MARKHTVDEVLRALDRKHDCKVVYNRVYILKSKESFNDLGNKSWGKIDFLCNHNGYTLVKTDKLPVYKHGEWYHHGVII